MKKFFLYSIPIIFILGSIGHFLYSLSGNNFIIGLFFPVNESIFEHTKLCFIPLLLFYIFGYYKFKPDKYKWISSFGLSLLFSVILIPILYYFYTGAFNYKSMIIDIIIFLIAVAIGQLFGLHYYKYGKRNLYILAIIFIIIHLVSNIIFTINPPKLPLFKDPNSNTYGIFKEKN